MINNVQIGSHILKSRRERRKAEDSVKQNLNSNPNFQN